MEITRREMRALNAALREWGHEAGVDIYTTNDIAAAVRGAAYEWGVNWSAQGTKSPSETKDFAAVLMTAVEIAEVLNKLELTETDCYERITDRQQYDATCDMMFNAIDAPIEKAKVLPMTIEALQVREKVWDD